MRVALMDDSVLFRQGLARLLLEVQIDVIATVGSEEELLAAVADDRPDVAILDIRLPPTYSEEGIRAAARLKQTHPEIGILVLSTYSEVAYAMALLEISPGGLGYLLKDQVGDISTLRDALVRVAAGGTAVDPGIIASLMAHRARAHPLDDLTHRERDVLRHMAEGRSNNGVAQSLSVSPRTVENYVQNIFGKLGLQVHNEDNRRVLAVIEWLRAESP